MLEIACFNKSSAIDAAKAGADRIELCAEYGVGGVTPSLDTLQQLREQIDIPINVMIRPRTGDFTYSVEEIGQMIESIKFFKPLASGFVFGILDTKNRVAQAENRQLVDIAAPLPCTFHRAFDQVQDMFAATEELIGCGFRAILTSGGPSDALSGAERVGKLHAAYGSEISFILGGGVRSTNIQYLKQKSEVVWFHSAAITTPPHEVADPNEVSRLQRILSNGD